MNRKKKAHSYDIIIPICKPGSEFGRVLDILKRQEPAPAKIILLETLEDGESLVPYEGCEVVAVKKEEFDHASTRRLGVSYSWSDAFIFLTQDALPVDTKLCAHLLEGLYAWEELPEAGSEPDAAQRDTHRTAGETDPADKASSAAIPQSAANAVTDSSSTVTAAINSTLDMDPDTSSWDNIPQEEYVRLIRKNEERKSTFPAVQDGRIAMCYGRQIAGDAASETEKFIRNFNYPDKSCVKSAEDIPTLGIKAYFASNVCCAYNRDIYESVMGFSKNEIFNEDMLYAAKVMRQGYRIAYAADAVVIHAHDYTAMQHFRRMFDNGMSQAMHPEVFAEVSSESEGKRLVGATAAHLLKTGHLLQIIRLFWQSAFKYFGFRAGKDYAKYTYRQMYSMAMNKAYIDRNFRD